LVAELLKHDVPFAATYSEPEGTGSIIGSLINIALPLFFLLTFLGPRLMGGMGGGGGPGGAGGGDSMNPFNMGKSKASLQMEPNTGMIRQRRIRFSWPG
jgi:hypothetical protein